MKFNCVERVLGRVFYQHGKFVGRHPWPYIVVSLLSACALCAGFLFFEKYSDTEQLFTPKNGKAKEERAIVQKYFPSNDDSEFLLISSPTLGRYGSIVFETLSESENIVSVGVMREILEFHREITSIQITWEGSEYAYAELCCKWGTQCFENDVLRYLEYNETLLNFKTLTYPKLQFEDGELVFIGATFGGITFANDSVISSARALRLNYYIRSDETVEDLQADLWERKYLDTVGQFRSEKLAFAYFTSKTIEWELDFSSKKVVPLFAVAFTILVTFSILSCLMFDWVQTKPMLASMGVLSAGLAAASSFGLMFFCQFPFIDIVAATPFLVIGIGVDDMFIMIAAWRRTSPKLSVPDRMGQALSEAAVSISITSLTDALAFGVGSFSNFPSVHIFCVYTGVAILFDFIYQITFFAGCMALDGWREKKNLHAVTFKKVVPKEKAPSSCYRWFCAGGMDASEMDAAEPTTEEGPVAKETGEEGGGHQLMNFFQNYYGKFITLKWVKGCVVLLYCGYVATAIVGCLQLEEGLELSRLAPDGSYSVDFYQARDEYFSEYGPVVMVMVTGEQPYWEPETQKKVEALLSEFENSDYFHGADFTISWLRDYLQFVQFLNPMDIMDAPGFNPTNTTDVPGFDPTNTTEAQPFDPTNTTEAQPFNLTSTKDSQPFDPTNGPTTTAQSFSDRQTFLSILVHNFLNISGYDRYKVDIDYVERDGEVVGIETARFYVMSSELKDANAEKAMMVESRRIADQAPFGEVATYHAVFIFYDQYLVILPSTLQSIGIALAAMALVSFILIPHLACILWVIVSVASICGGVIGIMSFWNVSLDAVTMINIIICIGFSVDFSAHIAYAFVSATGRSRNERAATALHFMGMPIMQGALSTILGVAILSTSTTYLFRAFFKTMFLVILLGAVHGILFLPVFLSIMGPGSTTSSDPTSDKYQIELESDKQQPHTSSKVKMSDAADTNANREVVDKPVNGAYQNQAFFLY